MKKNILKPFGLLLLVLSIQSCDDYLNDFERLEGTTSKPVATLSSTSGSALEGEDLTFTLTLSQALNESVDFKLEYMPNESSASFRDYVTSGVETTIDEGGYGQGSIGHKISVPAFENQVTFTISPKLDLLTEGTEELSILLRSSGNGLGLVDSASSIIKIEINDQVNDDFGIRLEWDGTYSDDFGSLAHPEYLSGGDPYTYDEYDFDFYVFDSAFNEVSGYQAATGNSPEMAIMSGLADDTYYVFADLYDVGPAPDEYFEFKDLGMKMTFSKIGNWTYEIPLEYYNSDSDDSFPFGLDGGEYLVAIVNKTGSTYELVDPNTLDVLITGRLAELKEKFRSFKNGKTNIRH